MTPTAHMGRSFGERFAYSKWLFHFRTGRTPSIEEIARAIDRTGAALTDWPERTDPPTDWRVHAPLADFFKVDERWLIRGEGNAPMRELWDAWIAHQPERRVAEPPTTYYGEDVKSTESQSRKQKAAGKRGRK